MTGAEPILITFSITEALKFGAALFTFIAAVFGLWWKYFRKKPEDQSDSSGKSNEVKELDNIIKDMKAELSEMKKEMSVIQKEISAISTVMDAKVESDIANLKEQHRELRDSIIRLQSKIDRLMDLMITYANKD